MHLPSLKMHHAHAHRKFQKSGFAPAHRNLLPHIAIRNLLSHIASHALVNISWILCIYCQWAKSQCVQMAMVLKEILKLIILGHFRTNPNEVDQKSYQLLVFGYKTIAPCLFVTTPCIFLFATKTHFRRAAKVQTYSFIWFNQKSKLSDWFSEIIHKGENTSCVQLEKKETRKRKTRMEQLSV